MPRLTSATSQLGKYRSPELIGTIHWTAFELKCVELNLVAFEEQSTSPKLRRWVEDNMRTYYVPEGLLKYWGLQVSDL